MNQEQRNELYNVLVNGIVEVTFTAVGTGETRIMPCTLNPEHTPEKDQPIAVDDVALRLNNSIAVWAMDKDNWRSFRWESVVGYAVLSDNNPIQTDLNFAENDTGVVGC